MLPSVKVDFFFQPVTISENLLSERPDIDVSAGYPCKYDYDLFN